jgi:large subunit ribosomal protein L24
MQSSKPSKQRKFLFNAPKHKLHRIMAAPLSTDLRSKHGRRSLPVRQGDTVRIVRGDFAGIEGKVTEVEVSKHRLFIQGVTREKVAGTAKNVPIHPSNVVITNLNLDDRWRADILKRPAGVSPAEETTETKTTDAAEVTEEAKVSA